MLKSLICLSVLCTAAPALACGVDTDCQAEGGIYRIDLPQGEASGAIIFAHGYRGTAAGTMRNKRLREVATDRGLAFVALNSGPEGWQIPNRPGNMSATGDAELAYVGSVMRKLADTHGVPADRTLITGFSAGGMLVWNLACRAPDMASGFVPVSGTFWLEAPKGCEGDPTNIIHIHGDADTTVPMQGRAIADSRQGDVIEALAMYRDWGGFGEGVIRTDGQLNCDGGRNDAGALLELCMFEGGHSFRRSFIEAAWDRLVDIGAIAGN